MIDVHLFTQMKALDPIFALIWAEGLNPLIPKTVNLLIFLVVMFFLLRRPFMQAMQDRRDSIKTELARAKAEKEEAVQKLRELESRLARLDEEIAQIRLNAEQESKAEHERLLKQTEDEGQRLRNLAEREIEGAAKAAQLQLKEYAASKAVELAEQIIRKEIKPEDDSRLIANFAKQLEEVK